MELSSFPGEIEVLAWQLQTIEELNVAGDGDSRSVLDAFFLGKALAEAINERIESSVGEFLSTIGRLQAEQQKQVEEFQVSMARIEIIAEDFL